MASSILIVDDSPPVRESLVRLFADGGVQVCGEADSGPAAIEKAQRLNPSLVVMDLSMPGMNGIEAARRLRQILPAVVIIILSDYGGMFPEQVARAAGIAAIVSKVECSSVLLREAKILLGQTAA